jgi:dihydroorotate dehydrogenase
LFLLFRYGQDYIMGIWKYSYTRYNTNVEVTKQTLDLRKPLMNAAGSLGFVPDTRSPVIWDQLGAFVTNPISRKPRRPSRGQRVLLFSGGVLLHTGHPNPGFSMSVRRFAGRWRRAPLPVIVHLLGDSPENMAAMLVRLEEIENVISVEIGLPDEVEASEAVEIIQASVGELPVIARLPLSRAEELGRSVSDAGAMVLSLGPPRGALPDLQGKLVYGRHCGPAVFPQALRVVRELVKMEVQVIGGGGVYQAEQTDAMLSAGAIGVQLDTVLWRGDWFVPSQTGDFSQEV